MRDFEQRLRECEMADEAWKRTTQIIDRVLPVIAINYSSREASTDASRRRGWAGIDRARDRNRVWSEIYPRIEAKVRAQYGRTSK